MKRLLHPLFLFAVAAAVCTSSAGEPGQEAAITNRYQGGFSTVLRLGMDVRRMMETKLRQKYPANPVFIDLEVTPQARPAVVSGDAGETRGVYLSAGFVDLANYVAHAKAIDLVEPGYFERYLTALSSESGELELKRLPGIENPAYWTLDVQNEQLSEFNQIVGMVLSINLAHHQHGVYDKYAAQLQDASGRPVPIASLMTNGEWLKSMRSATKNSLDAGLATIGFIALCEAIDRMPSRPAWTEFFAPRGVSFSKLRNDLRILESKFFAGQSL